MIAFCGQTRAKSLIAELAAHGVGECTVRGELMTRKRDPWFYDNGAYRDWKAGKAFEGVRFFRDMMRIRTDHRHGRPGPKNHGHPRFVVAPDIVMGGMKSFAFSCQWTRELADLPAYLAVQNGMTPTLIAKAEKKAPQKFVGIFVGGDTEWKEATGAGWVQFAHDTGRQCHIGRVGIPDRIKWARDIGADSIDSCLPLMHRRHLERFFAALEDR